MFEIGKKAVALYNFEVETKLYGKFGIIYPRRGEILTITAIELHPIPDYVMLRFAEYGLPLCSKNFAPVEEIGEVTFEDIMKRIPISAVEKGAA